MIDPDKKYVFYLLC